MEIQTDAAEKKLVSIGLYTADFYRIEMDYTYNAECIVRRQRPVKGHKRPSKGIQKVWY